jgi:hypothetical protein
MRVNISRWFLALIFLGLSSSIAMADGVDPKMGLQGGTGSTGLFSPNDPNFNFTVQGGDFTSVGQSKTFDFINATGQLAVGVNLVVTLLQGTPPLIFTCVPFSEYFTNCSPTTPTTLSDGGNLLIRFFTPNTGDGGFGGIPFATDLASPEQCDGIQNCSTTTAGADFGVVVTDVGGDLVHLGTGQGFEVQGSLVVPEPSTILLVLAGGILFLFFKRS